MIDHLLYTQVRKRIGIYTQAEWGKLRAAMPVAGSVGVAPFGGS